MQSTTGAGNATIREHDVDARLAIDLARWSSVPRPAGDQQQQQRRPPPPMEEALIKRITNSFTSLAQLAPVLASYWPAAFVEPRVRGTIHAALEVDALDPESIGAVLRPMVLHAAPFDDLLVRGESAALGVRLRLASLCRAVALSARESAGGLEAILGEDRIPIFHRTLIRLYHDRNMAVGVRAASAVGTLTARLPSALSKLAVIDRTTAPGQTARRAFCALMTQWLMGDVDDAALERALGTNAGSDVFVRASAITALRIGQRIAPRTALARVTSMIDGAPPEILAAAADFATHLLENADDAAMLIDRIRVEARRSGSSRHPMLAFYIGMRSERVEQILAGHRELCLCATASPRAALAAAGRTHALLAAAVSFIESHGGDPEADLVDQAIDIALFESTLGRDTAVAGAPTPLEARKRRDAWRDLALRVRAVRAKHLGDAVAVGDPHDRREQLRRLTHALDAAPRSISAPADTDGVTKVVTTKGESSAKPVGGSGPGGVADGPAIAAIVLDQLRQNKRKMLDRPLSIALAASLEPLVVGGWLRPIDVFCVAAFQQRGPLEHLAASFAYPVVADALHALIDLANAIDLVLTAPHPSRRERGTPTRPGKPLIGAARTLADRTRALAGTVSTLASNSDDHPVVRAFQETTAVALRLLTSGDDLPSLTNVWVEILERLGAGFDEASLRLSRPPPSRPRPEVVRKRIERQLHSAAMAHDVDEAEPCLPPAIDKLLPALLRANGVLGASSKALRWKGTTIGDYVVLRELGKGGMGHCLLARLRQPDAAKQPVESWVLKIPHLGPNGPIDPRTIRAAFREEALALLSLARSPHPGIVEFVGYHEHGYRVPYLVMRAVEGQSLAARLEQGKPLDLKDVLRFTIRLAEGIAHAHSMGVGHHDIKPANVILSTACGGLPVLVDFGLAGAEFRLGCGTPTYMAPERWGSDTPSSQVEVLAGDIWALGCVIGEMITSRPLIDEPFTKEDDLVRAGLTEVYAKMQSGAFRWQFVCATLASDPKLLRGRLAHALDGIVPAPVRSLIERALSIDPKERPSAQQLVREATALVS